MVKLTIPSRAAALTLACSFAHAQSEQVVFLEDFEAGLAKWTASPGFQLIDARSTCGAMVAPFPSGTRAAHYGDPSDCTFDNAPWPATLDLTTGVALPAGAQSARLEFDSYDATECPICEYDRRRIYASADGGPWTLIGENDQSFAWYRPSYDLTPFLGSTVRVRFHFDAVDSMYNFFLGWVIDDVRIVVTDLPQTYCSGKTNSLACVPFVTTTGVASATSTAPFRLLANDVPADATMVVLYGFQKANLDFHGGKLCIKAPIVRLPHKSAQPLGAPPCDGVVARNFNARIQGGADPALTAGATVFAQWRGRDVADPAGFGDTLTDAVRFTIEP